MTELFNIYVGDDNKACIYDTENYALSKFSRHVDLTYQFIVDHVRKEDVSLGYVSTDQMAANMMTKNQTKQKFMSLMRIIGIA